MGIYLSATLCRCVCFNGKAMRYIALNLVLFCCAVAWAQSTDKPGTHTTGDDYSGMYSFLRDGEFVQVSVEEGGKLSGFVSRFGDSESDRGAFLDHFIKQGTLAGHALNFTTETVHGVWFEFKGTADRGSGKTPDDEAYYVLKGTLTQHTIGLVIGGFSTAPVRCS